MRTLNFGHRGASYHAPENTLAAFRLARGLGADGVELDVQLSRDGIPVVMHDDTVDRTTNGSGAVADVVLCSLKTLDAGGWFSPGSAGEPVPTLAEVFEAVGQDLLLNLELKAVGLEQTGLEQAVASLVARHGMESRVLISSFNPMALQRVREADVRLPLALLYGPQLPQETLARWVDGLRPLTALHPEYHLLNEGRLSWARQHGCRVNTWTVDEPEDMRRLLALGVDGIITDRPDLLREILKETDRPGA